VKCLVIAEAGSCHDGDFMKARKLVRIAAACGADAVKFQYWSDSDALAHRRHAPTYRDVYRRYQLPHAWLDGLAHDAAHLGIEFLCTTYCAEDIAHVESLVSRFKISSFEARDRAFVAAHDAYDKDVIISTGMMSWSQAAMLIGGRHKLLHCVSAYPAPIDDMHLSVIRTRELDGLSDHSQHVAVGALAVAAGAQIIEAHLCLDSTDTANPDMAAALSPMYFAQYVKGIRQAEAICGTSTKRVQPSEREMSLHQVVS